MSSLILLPFVFVTVVMFIVSLQADHLILTKQLIKKFLTKLLFTPAFCFVQLSKKFLQLAGFFIPYVLTHSIEVFFCRSVSIWVYMSSLILLPFVFVTVVMFIVSLQADHLILTKQLIKKVFCLNYFLLLPICFVLLSKKFLQLAGFYFLLSWPFQLRFCFFSSVSI